MNDEDVGDQVPPCPRCRVQAWRADWSCCRVICKYCGLTLTEERLEERLSGPPKEEP